MEVRSLEGETVQSRHLMLWRHLLTIFLSLRSMHRLFRASQQSTISAVNARGSITAATALHCGRFWSSIVVSRFRFDSQLRISESEQQSSFSRSAQSLFSRWSGTVTSLLLETDRPTDRPTERRTGGRHQRANSLDR